MKNRQFTLVVVLALALALVWGYRLLERGGASRPGATRSLEPEEAVDASAFRGPLVSTLMMAAPQEDAPEVLESITRAVETQYGPLFDTLVLSDPQRRHLVNALAAYMGFWALGERGKGVLSEHDEAMQMQTALWNNLEGLLTPEQQQTFLEYDEELPHRLLFESIDLPLHIIADGLPEDTIAQARDILVRQYMEQRVGLNYAFDGPGCMSPAETIDKQRVAIEDTSRIWQETFPEDQFGRLKPFLDQQTSLLQHASEAVFLATGKGFQEPR